MGRVRKVVQFVFAVVALPFVLVAVRAGCRLCGVRFRGSGRLLGLG